MEEYFDIFDDSGKLIGTAPRSACHGNPALIHRVVHAAVFNSAGDAILLQKRLKTKKIQPGKWDSAVGGHVAAGETLMDAMRREMREELGVEVACKLWFTSEIRNEIESENVFVYRATCDGPFHFAPDEIETVAFFPLAEFQTETGRSRVDFTPNLVLELGEIVKRLNLERAKQS